VSYLGVWNIGVCSSHTSQLSFNCECHYNISCLCLQYTVNKQVMVC
jgi:hypothetical protein